MLWRGRGRLGAHMTDVVSDERHDHLPSHVLKIIGKSASGVVECVRKIQSFTRFIRKAIYEEHDGSEFFLMLGRPGKHRTANHSALCGIPSRQTIFEVDALCQFSGDRIQLWGMQSARQLLDVVLIRIVISRAKVPERVLNLGY